MTNNSIEKLTHARQWLAEAKTLDDVKHIVDIAEAARVYARAAKLGLEAYNDAAEVKVRAERRAGELLKQLERGKTGPKELHSNVECNSEYRVVLEEHEIPDTTAHRWQQMAKMDDETFEQHIAEMKPERPITTSGILREVTKMERPEIQPPDGKYRIIYADPPWKYNDKGLDEYGHAERHYPTMTIDQLCELPIKHLAEDNAALFLWVTSPLLEDAFQVVRAWGFEYKTSFVWDKVGHNFGHYNSVRHEFLLVCTRGSCTPDNLKLFDSVQSIEKTSIHSAKPEAFREIIDTLYTHGRRIELFSRGNAEGWEGWSNEPN